MSKCYSELQEELQELQDAFDYETNSEMRSDIEQQIDEVKTKIHSYNLSDDDLFQCGKCHCITDIEESVKSDDDGLICECCAEHETASELNCHECGQAMRYDDNNASQHINADGEVLHAEDADHVAFSTQEQ